MLDGQDLRQAQEPHRQACAPARPGGRPGAALFRDARLGRRGRGPHRPAAPRRAAAAPRHGGNLRRIHLVLDRCMYGLAAQGGGAIDGRLLRAALDDLDGGGPPAQRRPGWHALLALGGLGMAAIGVGAAYVWPVAPAPAAPAAVVARPSDAAPGQPAAEPSQASPAPDVGARPAAGVPSATLDEPSAPRWRRHRLRRLWPPHRLLRLRPCRPRLPCLPPCRPPPRPARARTSSAA